MKSEPVNLNQVSFTGRMSYAQNIMSLESLIAQIKCGERQDYWKSYLFEAIAKKHPHKFAFIRNQVSKLIDQGV